MRVRVVPAELCFVPGKKWHCWYQVLILFKVLRNFCPLWLPVCLALPLCLFLLLSLFVYLSVFFFFLLSFVSLTLSACLLSLSQFYCHCMSSHLSFSARVSTCLSLFIFLLFALWSPSACFSLFIWPVCLYISFCLRLQPWFLFLCG